VAEELDVEVGVAVGVEVGVPVALGVGVTVAAVQVDGVVGVPPVTGPN